MEKIPLLSGETKQRVSVDIDEVPYVFEVQWNDHAQKFYMSILTTDLVEIISGVCLVPNTPLIGRHKKEELPKGELFLFRVNSKNEYPTFDELDVGFWLVYIPKTTTLKAPILPIITSRYTETAWDEGITTWDNGDTKWDL
jgi:hypothetical protein